MGRRIRALGVAFGWLMGLGLASCEEANSGGAAATLCEGLEGYISSCGTLSACENALVRDCGALEGSVNPSFAAAVTDCLNALGTPMECVSDAVPQTTSSAAFQGFAQTICLCSEGASDGCENEVLTGENSDLGAAGRLARVMNDDVLGEVEDECLGGENCTDGFEDCALGVLSRSIPGETSDCLADAILGRFSDECGSGDTEGSDTEASDTDGSDSSPSGSDTNSSDGSDTNDSDTSDSSGDTDGVCTSEGCDCMFNEDCDDGLVCMGVCQGPSECNGEDPNEPNNGEIQATFLPPIGDSDGDGSSIEGELEAATDVDWFRYEGSDNAGSVVNPYAQLNVLALELCVYVECTEGLEATSITCPEGTTQQPSGGGRPGCCAANTMGFEVDMDCGGFNPFGDDSAIIYMSVTGSEPGVCQDYTLTYHF